MSLLKSTQEKMYQKIKSEIDCIDNEDGGFNSGKLWKLKKKLSPVNSDQPTAMKNSEGLLLTNDDEIKEEAKKHYKKVFEDKPMEDSINYLRQEREQLCMKRLEISRKYKTPPWTITDVKYAIKDLKKKVSKDPYDMPNELMMVENAGEDLILAITHLMNMMKEESIFPEALNLCNVTNAYKNKGERNSFDSYRGLFRTPIFRNILDRLLYNDLYLTVDSHLTDSNVGCRRGQNVRDNLFVINAISNEAKQKNGRPCDVCAYDVKKCFDNLWLHECINDIWEAGLQNDMLNLLFLANESAIIAIKTSSGTTDRITIRNTVMQGTVWGGLFCTCTMDKLGQEAYADPDLLYRYRQAVEVPPLEMVDDVVIVSECGATTVTTNAHMNLFIERKKLQLSKDKCARVHIGSSKCGECVKIYVHKEEMKSSEKEKYLGDFITKEGNSNETIKERVKRGYGILSQIKALLSEVPLGKRRVEIGLALRDAWFVNGCLFNSEVWSAYKPQNIQDLEKIDHMIIRCITGAQAKVPVEFLYLETSSLTISNVISVRRMGYLQVLLKRHTREITRRVYNAMKISPLPGDWIHNVKADFQGVGLDLNDKAIEKMDTTEYKHMIKKLVWKKNLAEMNEKKKTHTKVKHIQYDSLKKPQGYLLSHKFNNTMCNLLFNLRCRSVNGFKDNFHSIYGQEPLCELCGEHIDSQENALTCKVILKEFTQEENNTLKTIKYSHIFGDTDDQFDITIMFQSILDTRQRLLEASRQQAYPGINTGPD